MFFSRWEDLTHAIKERHLKSKLRCLKYALQRSNYQSILHLKLLQVCMAGISMPFFTHKHFPELSKYHWFPILGWINLHVGSHQNLQNAQYLQELTFTRVAIRLRPPLPEHTSETDHYFIEYSILSKLNSEDNFSGSIQWHFFHKSGIRNELLNFTRCPIACFICQRKFYQVSFYILR